MISLDRQVEMVLARNVLESEPFRFLSRAACFFAGQSKDEDDSIQFSVKDMGQDSDTHHPTISAFVQMILSAP